MFKNASFGLFVRNSSSQSVHLSPVVSLTFSAKFTPTSDTIRTNCCSLSTCPVRPTVTFRYNWRWTISWAALLFYPNDAAPAPAYRYGPKVCHVYGRVLNSCRSVYRYATLSVRLFSFLLFSDIYPSITLSFLLSLALFLGSGPKGDEIL